MKIDWIQIEHFGKFQNFSLSFPDGFLIIHGPNEAGKTTILAFIKAMLYGFGDSRGDIAQSDRKRYLPWDGSPMGGRMQITHENKQYIITRNSGKTKAGDKCSIINAITGEAAVLNLESILGVSETSFVKTLYIPQLGSAGIQKGSPEITNRLMSLASSGEEDASYEAAMKRLDDARRDLIHKKGGGGKIASLQAKVAALKEEKFRAEQLHHQLLNTLLAKKRLDAQARELESQLQQLPSDEPDLEKQKHIQDYQVLKESIRQCYERYNDAKAEQIRQEERLGMLVEKRFCPKRGMRRFLFWSAALCFAIAGCFYPLLFLGALALLALSFLPDKKYEEAKKALKQLEQDIQQATIANAAAVQTVEQLSGTLRDLELQLQMQKEELTERYGSFETIPKDDAVSQRRRHQLQDELMQAKSHSLELQSEIKIATASVRDSSLIVAELDEAVETLESYEKRYRALTLAQDTLSDIFCHMQQDFGPLLNQRAGQVLNGLIGQQKDLLISSDLVPSVGTHALSYFSNGTVDQVYLALRLALVDLVLGDTLCPLFLDDPFVQYDQQRLTNALAYLKTIPNRQIFLFTCHNYSEFCSRTGITILTI